jgi:hypothetical protein
LTRLRRLERVRAIAKRQLAGETAQAEDALAQLRTLASRTRDLAAEYATRSDAFDGFDLAQTGRFAAGLCNIVNSAGIEANAAQRLADRKLVELAAAERRRAAVEDRLHAAERLLGKRPAQASAASRRKIGTDLE